MRGLYFMLFPITLPDRRRFLLNITGIVIKDADGDYEVRIRYPIHDGGDELDDEIEARWEEIEKAFLHEKTSSTHN